MSVFNGVTICNERVCLRHAFREYTVRFVAAPTQLALRSCMKSPGHSGRWSFSLCFVRRERGASHSLVGSMRSGAVTAPRGLWRYGCELALSIVDAIVLRNAVLLSRTDQGELASLRRTPKQVSYESTSDVGSAGSRSDYFRRSLSAGLSADLDQLRIT